jgi:mannose-6-phosphate isomerase
LEATRFATRAGKVSPRLLADRSILINGDYFRVERIAMGGGRTSASLADEDETAPVLQYLFVAAGAARITGPEFAAVELPMGGMAAVPAASPEFLIEDLGGPDLSRLELIRITPRWPEGNR